MTPVNAGVLTVPDGSLLELVYVNIEQNVLRCSSKFKAALV